ncbi:ATP-dependent zinc metalloprotease FtsH [Tahibacter amnicola]|uniref:ATP-dependent zinc metalloprotease FtsH n=1 Tax=Tahibacter amnicola TaxID=2976241 RepID=A0ABY6BJF2_9GAMM|nr:ATP-dependent zinc metalloprotease FtsH [Tahibacter amnicola]UXI69721.1 ATP-dependent zinc metalloprotease FtsH [Tahibacter amnicola]
MNDMAKNLLIWLIIAAVLMTVFQQFNPRGAGPQELAYSEFMDRVKRNSVGEVLVKNDGRTIEAKLKDGSSVRTTAILTEANMADLEKNVEKLRVEPTDNGISVVGILVNWLPFLIFIGFLIYVMRQMQSGGGGRGAMSFGRSRARLQGEDQVKITFADVAGCDEAKEEVKELVDFLRDPGKFQKLGGKIPRGVLMVGSPGTGKTLLAKAIAGEAKVPFFTISGSDFVEMFVGVGAARVRDMFEQAKKHAPCIIFIDEIDAVGRHRGAGLGGGHDEREQTLNQLLVEMDGFEGNEGIIVIAATNRPDVLDPALLRPGRFDRQVVVPLPDVRGREQILKVHMRKVPVATDVDPLVIARGTPGFSGADLANLVNEAALFAARENSREVTMTHFDRAKDKIMMGAERRSMIMSEEEKRNTAYHEAGHAIIGRLVPEHDPVYKVTIIPRGRALGVTMYLPEGDRYSWNKIMLESRLCALYGGRVAEELIFGAGKVTTGASNDIERATQMARNMVTKWGLSDELGPVAYGEQEDEVFLGRSVTQHKNVSDETARKIDEVVRGILDRAYQRTREILADNMDKLHTMANALLQYETIDAPQIDAIMEGREPPPPRDWNGTNRPSNGNGSANSGGRGESPIGGPAVTSRNALPSDH